MATMSIRNLDERTLEALKRRAARNGRSLQAELKTIVERAALEEIDGRALAAEIRQRLRGRRHSDSTSLIAEDRQR